MEPDLRKVTLVYHGGPLVGTADIAIDVRRPPQRVGTEWGPYVFQGVDQLGRYVYTWEQE